MKQTTIDNIVTVDFMGSAVAPKTPYNYGGNTIDNKARTYTSNTGLGPVTLQGDNIKDIKYHLEQLPQVQRALNWYEKNHEQVFDTYAKGKGFTAAKIVAVGSADLPQGAVGGISVQGDSALLLGSRDFMNNVMRLGKQYGHNLEESLIMYHDHEKTHALGIKDELGVYTFTRDMYRDLAAKSTGETKAMYNRLAKTCDTRVKEYSKLEQKATSVPKSESMPYAA